MTPPQTTPTPKRERLNMGELRSANRTHAPDLERTAENQRPKTGDWAETKLYRYDGTDLYQWFGRRVEGIRRSPSAFWTACDEPFVIESTRPRTEGRGEGQPVAWAYEYTNHLKGDRAPGGWLRAVAFEAPTRARVNAGFARNVQPLYASPIREPEISSTGPMFILPGEDPVEYMALMRQKAAEMDREVFLEELAEAMFKVDEKHGPIRMNVPYGELKSFQRKQYERYAEAVADAILNLAPVGGRGEGSSRSCVESSLRCAPERVCAEALGKLIRYFEGGGDHDAGAFDESCPDCAALEEARDVLSSYETDGSARDLAEQLESWRKLIRRGLLEVRDHDALEGVLSAAAKELSPNTGG